MHERIDLEETADGFLAIKAVGMLFRRNIVQAASTELV